MAKALELNDTLNVLPSVPKAAQTPTLPVEAKSLDKTKPKQAPRIEREPLQVRWPADDVKAAKLAAIQLDFPTVSDFMLTCFHAYMKSSKQAK